MLQEEYIGVEEPGKIQDTFFLLLFSVSYCNWLLEWSVSPDISKTFNIP